MQTIILCGGMGTRLREETEYKPKPMVEIGGKPILWHIMKHYAFYGHKEFILALGYKGNCIRDYFLNYYKYKTDFTVDLAHSGEVRMESPAIGEDWRVTLVETGEKSMTGYRIKRCGKYIRDNRFMVTYGDAVANVNLRELIEFHVKGGRSGTVTGVYPPSRFGDLITNRDIVEVFNQQTRDTVHREPINGGYFVFERNFLEMIPDDPECDMEKKPLQDLVSRKQLGVFRHDGFWQCMDTYRDYQLLNDLWRRDPAWKIW
jgi:glucose-1-phosphate cytidylyltransferase